MDRWYGKGRDEMDRWYGQGREEEMDRGKEEEE